MSRRFGKLFAHARVSHNGVVSFLEPPMDHEPGEKVIIYERRDMTTDEFRAIGHRLIDWIADYRAGIAGRPVMARTAPGDVRLQWAPSASA
jgi:hypothetical protein